MNFSIGIRDLANPWKRLMLGVLLIVLASFCIIGKNWYMNVDRADCISVEAIFDDCKYHSGNDGIDINSIYLTFDDYGPNLDIHPSCVSNILTDKLMHLKSGTKMNLKVYEKTLTAYEIKVNGETWLDFDDACKKIENNYRIISYAAYVFLAAGVIFVITFVVGLFLGKKES